MYKQVFVLSWPAEGSPMAEALLDKALGALADGNRRAILAVIRTEPRPVGEVADDVGLSQQATSHHLRVLRTAGLVTETRAGTRHLFVVNTDGFAAVRAYLDDFWPAKLSALRAAVESRHGGGDG
jgi:DNA-binding transcriptional ArsR family regulator